MTIIVVQTWALWIFIALVGIDAALTLLQIWLERKVRNQQQRKQIAEWVAGLESTLCGPDSNCVICRVPADCELIDNVLQSMRKATTP